MNDESTLLVSVDLDADVTADRARPSGRRPGRPRSGRAAAVRQSAPRSTPSRRRSRARVDACGRARCVGAGDPAQPRTAPASIRHATSARLEARRRSGTAAVDGLDCRTDRHGRTTDAGRPSTAATARVPRRPSWPVASAPRGSSFERSAPDGDAASHTAGGRGAAPPTWPDSAPSPPTTPERRSPPTRRRPRRGSRPLRRPPLSAAPNSTPASTMPLHRGDRPRATEHTSGAGDLHVRRRRRTPGPRRAGHDQSIDDRLTASQQAILELQLPLLPRRRLRRRTRAALWNHRRRRRYRRGPRSGPCIPGGELPRSRPCAPSVSGG